MTTNNKYESFEFNVLVCNFAHLVKQKKKVQIFSALSLVEGKDYLHLA